MPRCYKERCYFRHWLTLLSLYLQKVVPFLQGCYVEYAKSGSGADKKTGTKIAKVWPKHFDHECLLRLHLDLDVPRQGDGRFVITAKGAKIMLSFKSAVEELAEVLENANKEETAFPVTSFKVRCFTHCLNALASCHAHTHQGTVVFGHQTGCHCTQSLQPHCIWGTQVNCF